MGSLFEDDIWGRAGANRGPIHREGAAEEDLSKRPSRDSKAARSDLTNTDLLHSERTDEEPEQLARDRPNDRHRNDPARS